MIAVKWLLGYLCLLLGADLISAEKLSTVLTVDHDDERDSGTANCSISGVTLPFKLKVTVDELSTPAVKIKNEEEKWGEFITNETSYYYVMAEYEIIRCINTFILYCSPATDQNNTYIRSSSLIVDTDGAHCQEKSGNPALVVILILVILAVIVSAAGFIYKKRNGLNVATELYSKARGGSKGSKHLEEIHDEENAVTEPLTSKTPTKTPKDMFVALLCQFCEKLEKEEINTIKEQEFQKLVTEFYSAHEVDPFPYIEEFVKAEHLENEVAMKLAIHFAECERNAWILSSKVAKLINTALEKQQLPLEQRLKTFGDMYLKKQINADEYILVTLSLFNDKKIVFEKAIEELQLLTDMVNHDLLDELLQCLEEFLNSDYEVLKPIIINEDGTNVEVIISPEPDLDAEGDNRLQILKSLSGSKSVYGVLLRLLLLGVDREVIDLDVCITILKDCNQQLHHEYTYIITSGEEWISRKTFINLLKGCRRSDLDTDSFFVLQLSTLLLNAVLSISEYLEELKSSLEDNLISKECLVSQLDGCIQSAKLTKQSQVELFRKALDEDWITGDVLQQKIGDEWGKEEWVKMLLPITIGRHKENVKTVDLLIEVIKKYQISKADMKIILDSAGIPDELQEQLLQNDKISKKLDKNRKSKKVKK